MAFWEDEGVEWRESKGVIYEHCEDQSVYCAGDIDQESEHEAARKQQSTLFTVQDDKRTMTGYSIQRSPNRKIRRRGEESSGGRLPGIYSPLPVPRLFHFTLCPSKLVPGNKATKLPQLRILLSHFHPRPKQLSLPLSSVICSKREQKFNEPKT